MAALNNETRLVMTILFAGTLSGSAVFFYAKYGTGLPYSPMVHAGLFGLTTIGVIMIMKAMFDLFLNDKIELWLLDRKIDAYWSRKQRDAEQFNKMRGRAQACGTGLTTQFKQSPPRLTASAEPTGEIGNEFLTSLQ